MKEGKGSDSITIINITAVLTCLEDTHFEKHRHITL